ncbi:MAG: 30S ribosomal protein S4 [Clostridia bacterium]|nr:30S ribosomal protein S4 [Clostridia bacterium]
MARYTGSDCRQCRREGGKLFLKGDKCYSAKCPFLSRPTIPGQHGAGRRKVSEYGLQLREKQKVKRIYGLLEKQFRMVFERAEKMKGATGENMLILLERRLDNVVYRLGLAKSRSQARQIVNHGHITVNGRKVNIPSYIIKAGDVIAVKENKKENNYFKAVSESVKLTIPGWLVYDAEKMEGRVQALPQRSDIDATISENMIVELYSR